MLVFEKMGSHNFVRAHIWTYMIADLTYMTRWHAVACLEQSDVEIFTVQIFDGHAVSRKGLHHSYLSPHTSLNCPSLSCTEACIIHIMVSTSSRKVENVHQQQVLIIPPSACCWVACADWNYAIQPMCVVDITNGTLLTCSGLQARKRASPGQGPCSTFQWQSNHPANA